MSYEDSQDDTGTEALPKITPQQRKFVMGILSGKTQADAYREAYNCTGKSGNVRINASKLAAHPKIRAWIRHAQGIGADQAGLTHESHLAELARLRELAVDATQIAAGVQAEVARGKASGLYQENVRLHVSGLSDEELLRGIVDFMGLEIGNTLALYLTGQDLEALDVQGGKGDEAD